VALIIVESGRYQSTKSSVTAAPPDVNMLHTVQENAALGDEGNLSGEGDKGLWWNENDEDMERPCIAMRPKREAW
jgi:hypothetical protein